MSFFSFSEGKELPISSQHFSGTDKDKDSSLSIGVVYPLSCDESVKNELVISSILDHRDNNLCKLTEARVANADTEKKELEYIQTPVIAVEYNTAQQVFKDLFQMNDNTVYQARYPITDLLKSKLKGIFTNILKDFRAEVFVDKELIKERKYSFINYKPYSPVVSSMYSKQNSLFSTLNKADKEAIETISGLFINYLASLKTENPTMYKDTIAYAIRKYHEEQKFSSVLTKRVLGDEIFALKKDINYKDYFKKADFREELSMEIIGIIEEFDLGITPL